MSRSPRAAGVRRDWGEDDSSAPILHVDMDAFFAAVELIDRPELRGLPVIVGGEHRGVVLSATYEARALGVRSAMPMRRARILAPRAIVIRPDHARYREVSRSVMQILGDITPVIEPVSIDEAFLDVSGARRRIGGPSRISRLIRARIAAELHVVASVGIASTKFVAKLASQHAKPDGMLLVPHEATIDFLHQLPVGALWGVGERTEAGLAGAGITTVAALAETPVARLAALVGVRGAERLHDLSWGRDPRPVEPVRAEKSIGHEQTFPTDLTDLDELNAALLDQAHRCAARLRAAEVLGGTVSIKVRMHDFTTLSRSRTLAAPTDVAHELYGAAKALLAGMSGLSRGVRLLGIRCESLQPAATVAIQAAFDDPGPERRDAERAMDEVRARFGSEAMRVGSLVRGPGTENGEGELS
ncbi:DNA polymerase IV [Pseudactinotalea sp. HY158]|uniref:DNA polymerase IV n=1 Tax=Pseudactinotalea sp. HY158 TaxID=2654547 RepID=UPI00129C7D42|nr:DNA polymerase IV [Pseudactinotalea sp. HY158]QGH69841.1 DNA polymerase IV [Pseudactinotalea sp. HY158]